MWMKMDNAFLQKVERPYFFLKRTNAVIMQLNTTKCFDKTPLETTKK